MRKILFIIFFYFFLTAIKSQKFIGLGIGADYMIDSKSIPYYAEKDVNLSFSNSWHFFSIEGRQGFRYMDAFKANRYNSYLLIGFTTPKEKFFVFDFLTGFAYSWTTEDNSQKAYTYFNQICPTIKSSFLFRISNKYRLYLGLDGLISSYRYLSGYGTTGSRYEAGDLTGSVLVSVNYRFNKKSENSK